MKSLIQISSSSQQKKILAYRQDYFIIYDKKAGAEF
jgi:hypothetical protein